MLLEQKKQEAVKNELY